VTDSPNFHERLEGLARAATPGPWYLRTNRHPATNGNDWGWLDAYPPGGRQSAPEGVAVTWEAGRQSRHNAAYIAAVHPQAILALIAENRAYREALEAHDRYMIDAGYEGPDSSSLHPKAAENWRRVRAVLTPIQQGGQSHE